jgi:hypothetical protein
MFKYIIGFVVGFIISTVGIAGFFTAATNLFDKSVEVVNEAVPSIDNAVEKGKEVVRGVSK